MYCRNVYSRGMTEEKMQFVARLIDIVTALGYPEHGRQTQLAVYYKVTQGAARKWFAAEAMPSYEISVDLCKRARVHYEWLMTGRGPRSIDDYPIADPRIAQVVKIMQTMSDYKMEQAVKIVHTLAEPASTKNGN